MGRPPQTGWKAPNPFAASRTRPGTLPFLFEAGNLADLVARFQRAGNQGQIVGPHGSGKTTLLLALVQALRAIGQSVVLIRLPARSDASFRDMVRQLHALARTMRSGILAVDGWDQLSLASRLRISGYVFIRRLGILITTHRPTWRPLLMRTSTTCETAHRVLSRLLDQASLDRETRDRLQATLAANLPELLQFHGGNLREVLFSLYDRYEQLSGRAVALRPERPGDSPPAILD